MWVYFPPAVWSDRQFDSTGNVVTHQTGVGGSLSRVQSEEGFPTSTAQLCCYGRCRPPVPCHHVRPGTGRADDIKRDPPRCPIKSEPFEHRDKTGAAFERTGKDRVDIAGSQTPVRLCERQKKKTKKMHCCGCDTGTGCNGASTSPAGASLSVSACYTSFHLQGGSVCVLVNETVQAGVWHRPWADASNHVRRMTMENQTLAASKPLLAS